MNNATFTPASSTVYVVSGTNANGCVASQSISIPVINIPTVTAVVSSTGVCAGKSVTMTANGASTYVWTNGVTNAASYTPATTSNYTVTGSNTCGTSTAVVSVTVFALPTVSATASSPSVCAGAGVTLNGNGATSYSWNPNISNNTSFTPVATANYTVTGTDGNGCSSTGTIGITLVANPTVITSTSTLICTGASATLAASATSYSWSTSATTSSIVVSPTINTVYSVLATNAQGCAVTNTIAITVNNTPTVSAVVTSTSVCAGKSVTMTASGANTYAWTNGVTNAASYTPAATSNYTVTGTNACGTSTAAVSVTVFALPSVTATATSPSICAGSTVAVNGAGALTYTWMPNVSNNTAFSPTITITYTVNGTDGNGCISAKSMTTITVVNVPTVNATVSSNSVCAGKTVTMTATGATSYIWTNGVTNATSYTPAATSDYTVTGVNACGTSSAVVSVTVGSLPPVTASASSPSICSGNTVVLNGGGSPSYTWNPSVANNTTFTPSSTTNYTVTGVAANGCTAQAAVSVTVVNTPSISPVSTSSAICLGATATISAVGAAGYTWSAQNFVTSNSASIAVSPTVNTTYTVNRANSTCTTTAVISLVVNSLPTVTASQAATVCACTGSAVLSATGGVTYNWMPVNVSGGSLTVYPCSTTIYTVTGTNAFCTNTATVMITTSALPSITIAATVPSICIGGTVGLVASGAQSFTWTSQPTASVFPGGAGIVVSPTVPMVYTAAGTNSLGCVSSALQIVNVNLIPPTMASASSSLICAGETATLSASGADTYSWTIGGGLSAQSVTTSPVAASIYTVTGFTNAGCSKSTTVSVSVSTLQLAVTGNTTVCSGKSILLTGSGGTGLTWAGHSPFALLSITPSATAVYTLTGTDDNNCSLTKTISVVVNPNPVVNISATQTLICKGETVTLTANGGNSYVWGASAGSATATAIVITPPSVFTYNYDVTGSNSAGCQTTASVAIVVDACTGINNLTTDNMMITIYPNPNNGHFTIKGGANAQLTIVNSVGQLVRTVSISGSEEISVD